MYILSFRVPTAKRRVMFILIDYHWCSERDPQTRREKLKPLILKKKLYELEINVAVLKLVLI